MKTVSYNPSTIEKEFAEVISKLTKEIENGLTENKIVSIENKLMADNPTLTFYLEDKDGDKHEVVVKIIQRMDS